MKKTVQKTMTTLALIVAMMTAAAADVQAQTVNMNRYMTLTVKGGEQIKLRFIAASRGTPVRIVSRSKTYDIIVYDHRRFTEELKFLSDGTEMTVYGDITGFDCSKNGANVTSLDVSNNTKLERLECYQNNFTSAALDGLYCSLSSPYGTIYPVFDSSDPQHAAVKASNATIAKAKGWKVRYELNESNITTTGTGGCRPLNMNRYIRLSVKSGEQIKLLFKAASGTPVRIVSGSKTYDITTYDLPLNPLLGEELMFLSDGTTMTVYGDLVGFNCSGNNDNISAIDVSKNTELRELVCSSNRLTSLDVSKNKALTELHCSNNRLTSLDVSKNTELRELGCRNNQLTSLEISLNKELKKLDCSGNPLRSLNLIWNNWLESLYCSDNQLTSLDVSKNTELRVLGCHKNQLSTLDVSKNTKLERLYCYSNNFRAYTLNRIYCSLPKRSSEAGAGSIYPAQSSSDPQHAAAVASNGSIATKKNWKVTYPNGNSISTTGTKDCSDPDASRYIRLSIRRGETIKLRFKATSDDVPISIWSGSKRYKIYTGRANLWTKFENFETDANDYTMYMYVYGDFSAFDCSDNGKNIHMVDASEHPDLIELNCSGNGLGRLDVSKNTGLMYLSCSKNSFDRLDVSQNTELRELNCDNNQLSTLDLSKNEKLWELNCSMNEFTTTTLNRLYCSLHDRRGYGIRQGVIHPAHDSSDPAHAVVLASSGSIATPKNWVVRYKSNNKSIPTTGTAICQDPNMNRYISLSVKRGETIKFSLKTDLPYAPVRVVNGDNTHDMTTGQYGVASNLSYTAESHTITVYGNITYFSCYDNRDKLYFLDVSKSTALEELNCSNNGFRQIDVSQNTKLKFLCCDNNELTELDLNNNTALERLYCYKNRFSSTALDRLYCSLSDRRSKTEGIIRTAHDSSDPTHAVVLASSGSIATNKNWKLQYGSSDNKDIPTTGTAICQEPEMSRYITLTVKSGEKIILNDLKAAADETPVRIVSGSNTYNTVAGIYGSPVAGYIAGSTTMRVYGNLIGFNCYDNRQNLTGIDVSNNTALVELNCSYNALTTLDVSELTALTHLECHGNQLSSLDVSKNSALTYMNCSGNQLTSLDVSNNRALTQLLCYSSEQLTSAAIDRLYCSLPDRSSETKGGYISMSYGPYSIDEKVLASSGSIATKKNWKVRDFSHGQDIATTGTGVCEGSGIDTVLAAALRLYPNPVENVLRIKADGSEVRSIHIYNVYGAEVATATATKQIDLSGLPAGIYAVQVNTDKGIATQRVVKR